MPPSPADLEQTFHMHASTMPVFAALFVIPQHMSMHLQIDSNKLQETQTGMIWPGPITRTKCHLPNGMVARALVQWGKDVV